MRKVFWDHLIKIDEIHIQIDSHGFTKDEKHNLLHIAYQTIDMRVMETILTHLPKEKHKQFLEYFAKEPHHPKLLDMLKKDIYDIEDKIQNVVKDIKKEIFKELNKI